MIYNKFINCQTRAIFDSSLASGEIIDQHIVFIEDVKQIWTNGVFYGVDEFSAEDLAMLTKLADVLVMDGDGTKVLANNGTYITMPSFTEAESETLINLAKLIVIDGDGTKVLANNGTYVSMPQLDTTDVTSIKNLLSIIKTDGSGNKVLADDGTYIELGKLGKVNVGSETKHVYFKDGDAVASSSTIGSSSKPVWLSSGAITECGSSLSVDITGSAGSVAWNNVSSKPSSFTPSSHTHTKSEVGLSNVDNTADANKSVNYAASAGYVTRSRNANTVTTLANLPIDKDTVVLNGPSAATEISLSADMNVGESLTIFGVAPTAAYPQPIPTSGKFRSMDGDSLNITTDKDFEINIYCYATGSYSISCKTSK